MERKSRFPDSLVLIFGMIVLAQALTYLLPAGVYDMETVENGRQRVVPGTFHQVEADPLPMHAFLSSIPKGMEEAAEIIFFVFIIGGAIGVIRATGAWDALIGSAIRRLGGNRLLLIGGMTTLFALGSGLIGMAEEYVPFIPILVTMAVALGMDSIVAMGIVYVGYGVGYGSAPLNPFTVLIAQDISGLPPTSGAGFRWSVLAIMLVVGIHHILRYARRVERDPGVSLVHDVDYSTGFELPDDTRMTTPRLLVLLSFVAAIGIFVWGVRKYEWYLTELSTVFLALALVAAAIGRLSPNRVAKEFCVGAGELTTAALLIGFARTIKVVLDDGQIIHTIIHGIAAPLQSLGPTLAAVGMLAVQTVCNLFIPSGSGQAYVTMPIMAPLSDLVGVTRQTAVLAFQYGDGLTNTIIPTNALLMGMLALARIPYTRWIRFIVPFLLKMYAIAIASLAVAVAIGYA